MPARQTKLLAVAFLLAVVFFSCFLSASAINEKDTPLNKVKWLRAPKHAPVILVRDGKSEAVIVIPSDAAIKAKALQSEYEGSILPAAAAVRKYVGKVTGAEMEIVTEDKYAAMNPVPRAIFIGAGKKTAVLGLEPAKLPLEGFYIKTFDDGIAIVGRDGWWNEDDRYGDPSRGTLWGAYDFIERFLGVRFYYPGIGTCLPKSTMLEIAPVYYTDHPRFRMRQEWNFFREFKNEWPWDKNQYPVDWQEMRWRFRVAQTLSTGMMAHTPVGWAHLYGKTQPELFYKDRFGIRHIGEYNPSAASQYDVSNPAVVQRYVDDLKKFYETGWDEAWRMPPYDKSAPANRAPRKNVIPFGLMDCVHQNESSPLYNANRPGGEMSDVLADFYVKLAAEIKKLWPEKKLLGAAYQNYRFAPVKVKDLPDNLYLILAVYDAICPSEESFEKEVDNVREWCKIMKHKPTLWLYLPPGTDAPMYSLSMFPKLYGKIISQTDGVFFDCPGPWAKDHIIEYIRFRMSWNPDFNIDAALDEYYRLAYGPAAEPMKKIFTALIDAWAGYKVPGSERTTGRDIKDMYQKLYPPDFVARIKNWLEEAKSAAPAGSVEALRVDFYAKGLAPFFVQSGRVMQSIAAERKLKAEVVKAGAIVIDGKLDDTGWKSCAPVEFRPEKGDTAKYPAYVKIARDDNNLYFAFSMTDDKLSELKAAVNVRDGNVWEDDGVEMFLSPGKQKDKFFQFIINPAGTLYDELWTIQRGDNPVPQNWSCEDIEIKTGKAQDCWTIEARIPFKSLNAKAPARGDTWYVNFVRNKRTDPRGDQAIAPTFGNNHYMEFWALLDY